VSLERFQQAVVVFVEVDAVDDIDAGHVAERAVEQALRNRFTGRGPDYYELPLRTPRGEVRLARVFSVSELGVAARNGGLWVSPTAQTFRRYNEEEAG
jgi:hypothetical protein